ncbi:hypothetical protein MUK42_26079 [Musa troglodytarum]|uniref:Uncharacterized protein n=1 Tax=Musa troglodytarum TaxID=320322 RepID=A0A9E7JD04_9LILI|nr:hypothetical protein MUK42_26079 [Musa troglodytarum]
MGRLSLCKRCGDALDGRARVTCAEPVRRLYLRRASSSTPAWNLRGIRDLTDLSSEMPRCCCRWVVEEGLLCHLLREREGPFQIDPLRLFAEHEACDSLLAPGGVFCGRSPSATPLSGRPLRLLGTTPSADTRRFGGGGMAARNGRWQPPPAPTILNLPRLPRRSRAAAPRNPGLDRNLGDLADRERSARPLPQPASQVMMVEAEATSAGESRRDSGGEERWRFQAEILRAECNFLRMEREVALRKLERNRTEMEIALKSAMETLVSGRKKIDGCGSVGTALDEEIEELEELKLGNSNRRKRSTGSSRKLLRGSCRGDFDRRAFMLRRQQKKMEEDTGVKGIQEISVEAFAKKGPEAARHEPEDHDVAAYSNHSRLFTDDMEKLRKKMEGMSKGMLERMEECSYLLSAKSSTITTTTTTKGEWNCSSQQTTGITEAADMAHSPILQIQQQQQEKLVSVIQNHLVSFQKWHCCTFTRHATDTQLRGTCMWGTTGVPRRTCTELSFQTSSIPLLLDTEWLGLSAVVDLCTAGQTVSK